MFKYLIVFVLLVALNPSSYASNTPFLNADPLLGGMGDAFEVLMADNRDIIIIEKSSTSNSAVTVLSAIHDYKRTSLRTSTALEYPDDSLAFVIAGNRDLVAINQSNTVSGKIEVTVLSATHDYQTISLNKNTALNTSGNEFTFLMAGNRDLFAIQKITPKTVKIYVLSALHDYEKISSSVVTPLPMDEGSELFIKKNRDIWLVKPGVGNSTEVQVLSAKSGYFERTVHAVDIGYENNNSSGVLVPSGATGIVTVKNVNLQTPSLDAYVTKRLPEGRKIARTNQLKDFVKSLNGLVGYWPADDGSGTVLKDLSGNNNLGKAINIAWNNNALEFTGKHYQWVEITDHYSESFTVGGWFHSDHAFHNDPGDHGYYHSPGVSLIGNPLLSGYHTWSVKDGKQNPDYGLNITLQREADKTHPGYTKGDHYIGIHSAEVDVLGTVSNKHILQPGVWQHIIYTFHNGVGSLYINGDLIVGSSGVAHKMTMDPDDIANNIPLIVGGNLGTWNVIYRTSTAFKGSISGLIVKQGVMFQTEIRSLKALSKPENLILDGEVEIEETPTPTELISIIMNSNLSEDARAESVLTLTSLNEAAEPFTNDLINLLSALTQSETPSIPKVENFLENALINALLEIAPNDERAKSLLADIYIKPVFDLLDLSEPHLSDVKAKIDSKDYFGAHALYKTMLTNLPPILPRYEGDYTNWWGFASPDDVINALPLNTLHFDRIITAGNPFSDKTYQKDDYTPWDIYNGITYMTYVEKLSFSEVQNQCEIIPDCNIGLVDEDGLWARLKIIKVLPDKSTEEVFLEGPWFIFNTRDAKIQGWALGVDKEGNIHVVGGQHNSPQGGKNYLPGALKKANITSYNLMYWKTQSTGDIGSLSFAGNTGYPVVTNYFSFSRNPVDNTLFLFGRSSRWTWGVSKYDTVQKRWINLQSPYSDVIDDINDPYYFELQSARDSKIPPLGSRSSFAASWRPASYDVNRDKWGVRFDKTGRLYIHMRQDGLSASGEVTKGPLFVYSDDNGETFYRADGTRVKLPLTVNPAPNHNASLQSGSNQAIYDVWVKLLKEFGYPVPR